MDTNFQSSEPQSKALIPIQRDYESYITKLKLNL